MAKTHTLIGRIYQARDGAWRWKLVGRNGEQVAQGQGYTRKADALRGLRRANPTAAVDMPIVWKKASR